MAIYVTITESLSSVTFPMIPDESVATLKERWAAASERNASHFVFRTSNGATMQNEAAIQDFLRDPNSNAIEALAEMLESVEFAVVGFPEAQCRLPVSLVRIFILSHLLLFTA